MPIVSGEEWIRAKSKVWNPIRTIIIWIVVASAVSILDIYSNLKTISFLHFALLPLAMAWIWLEKRSNRLQPPRMD